MRKLILFLLVGMAFGQNARYDDIALGPKGSIPFASVAVCSPQPANTVQTPCTPLAPLCSSLTDAICNSPNPLLADFLGNYHFYLKNSAIPFTVQIYGPQVAAPFVMVDQGVTGNGGGVIGTCTANTFTGWITALTVGCAPATFAGNNSLFAGSVSTQNDGTHSGGVLIAGNTAPPIIPATDYFGFVGFGSTSAGSYVFVPDTTQPTVGQILTAGTPATCTGSSATCIPMVYSNPVAATYLPCEDGITGGLSAMAAGTYVQSSCWNNSGSTLTITGISCHTNNSGTSTLTVADNLGNALLTGPITCGPSFVAGTQSSHVTILNHGYITFTYISDGTTVETKWHVDL